MANVAYPGATGITGKTEAATFIPEIWSDEIIASYEKNLVLANLVNRMPMTGKKGDVIHIPKPTRGQANEKVENTVVKIQANTESEVQVQINKHYEYSRMIEDIVDVQALNSLRQFYTSDAGYALALQVDTHLADLALTLDNTAGASSSDATAIKSYYQVTASTGALADYADSGTLADLTADGVFDKALRNMIQKLDDQDVPMDGRSLVIPPSIRNTIMGIDRYVSSDFVAGQPVQNGLIGNLYGVDIYVTNNCKTHTGTTKSGTVMMLLQRDAFVFAEQMGVRTQTQYKQEYLGDLFTADTLYGTATLRKENAVAVLV